MELKNITIIGAGSSVGRTLIPLLLKCPEFTITALLRPTSTYTPPSPLVSTKTVDFSSPDSDSLIQALHGTDALLSLVPPSATKFDVQKPVIDAAVAAGVKVYLASEFSADILSAIYAVLPTEVVGDKVLSRQYLEDLAKEGRINWMAINGGPFFDMWLMKGPAGFNLQTRKATIYGTGNKKLEWTPLPTICAAMVTMLKSPTAVLNRPTFILGVDNLTQHTLLAALEAEMGDGRPFEREYLDVVPIKQEAMALLGRGEVRQAMRGLTIDAQFGGEGERVGFAAKVENELVGVKPVEVREAVRAAFEEYGFKV
ncbi:MAG: hypothetical protein M1813_009013 [Trichoglossum hirsutum]|nr:MAG: hypothetical protein M1813_009013 [Trichoglossum hirsutum]